jgi:hypothetical protein
MVGVVNLVLLDAETHAVGRRDLVVFHAPLLHVRANVMQVLVGTEVAAV